MILLLLHLLRLLPFLFGGHRQLALENLALRHQISVYKRTVTRPRLCRTDRFFWVTLARVWAGWRQPSPSLPPTPSCGGSGAGSASTGPGSPADPPEGARPSTPRSKSWSCEWPPPTRSGARRESTASSSSSASPWPSAPSPG